MARLETAQAKAYTYTDTSITTAEQCLAAGGTAPLSKPGSVTAFSCQLSSTPAQEARMMLAAGWLAGCLAHQNDISASDLANNQLNSTQENQIIGVVLNNSDGMIPCNTPANVSAALQEVSYPDLLSLAKTAGCVAADAGSLHCSALRNGDQFGNKAYQKIVNSKWGAGTAALTDVEKYYIVFNTFVAGCQANKIANPTAAETNAAKPSGDNSSHFFQITEVSPAGIVISPKSVYKAVFQRDRDISTANPSLSWNDGTFSCATLANMTGSYASNYASWVKYHQKLAAAMTVLVNPAKDGPAAKDNSTSTCTIDGIGWIVCPVMSFMGKITDTAFNFLASNFLETKANVVTNPSTVNAWSVMRNIANVGFVIAFLIIIFSQLSSVGITNYGVKKMLPRLVVAALLVNLSFFLCQIAVDISNIMGYSLKSLFDGFQNYTQTPGVVTASANSNGWGIAAIVAGVLAGGITLAFAVTVPVLLAALLALMLIVMILFARTALIILLVVVSPLAFVAYLLPNTEQYFKKWYKMFFGLLLVFPIIAVVVGSAGLAAGILKAAAGDDKMLQVVAMGVATIPLFVVPSLLKNAMGAAGTIGTKMSGLSSKMNGRVNSKGKQAFGNSKLGQYKKYREGESAQRRALIQSGTYEGRGGKFNPHNLTSGINKRINESARSGKFGDRSSTQGNALQDAEDAELVKNAGSRLDYFDQPNKNPLSQAQMMQIATGQDVTDTGLAGGVVVGSAKTFDVHARKAAIQRSAKIATVAEAQTLVDASGKDSSGKDMMTAGERLTLVSSLAGSSAVAKAPYLGGETFGDITQGRASTNESARRALQKGKINAEALAGGDKDSVKKMVEAAKLTAVGSIERANLKAAYTEYLAAPRLHERVVAGGAHDIQLVSIGTL